MDLVSELRDRNLKSDLGDNLCASAADEIERLQVREAAALKLAESYQVENERLRAALSACIEFWRDPEIPCPTWLHDQVADALSGYQQYGGEK